METCRSNISFIHKNFTLGAKLPRELAIAVRLGFYDIMIRPLLKLYLKCTYNFEREWVKEKIMLVM